MMNNSTTRRTFTSRGSNLEPWDPQVALVSFCLRKRGQRWRRLVQTVVFMEDSSAFKAETGIFFPAQILCFGERFLLYLQHILFGVTQIVRYFSGGGLLLRILRTGGKGLAAGASERQGEVCLGWITKIYTSCEGIFTNFKLGTQQSVKDKHSKV
ncbi:hypothetical protein SUGI_0416620 [Cryptomeria japonica]|nr:hypothetical protein SUGI_0416620 [Cryptomeria japonica]